MTFVSDRSFYGFYGCRQQDKTTRQDKTRQNNSVELVASLAPAEAEIGALAKADQNCQTYFALLMQMLANLSMSISGWHDIVRSDHVPCLGRLLPRY